MLVYVVLMALTDFDSDPPWFMLNSGQLMMKLAHWRQLPWLLCQKLRFKLRSCICHAFLETLVCYLFDCDFLVRFFPCCVSSNITELQQGVFDTIVVIASLVYDVSQWRVLHFAGNC